MVTGVFALDCDGDYVAECLWIYFERGHAPLKVKLRWRGFTDFSEPPRARAFQEASYKLALCPAIFLARGKTVEFSLLLDESVNIGRKRPRALIALFGFKTFHQLM